MREIYAKMEFVFKPLLNPDFEYSALKFRTAMESFSSILGSIPQSANYNNPRTTITTTTTTSISIQGFTTNPISNVLTAHAHNIPISNVTDLTEKENFKQKNGSEDKTRS
jgi:hypothetical protein